MTASISNTNTVQILGVRVDDVTMQEACDRLQALITQGGLHQVATVNPEFIMTARDDPDFAEVLEHTTLNVPDGVGVLWASRRAGHPLRERVAGVDLVRQLCARGSQYQWRAFFLGARPGVAERAAANLALKYQGLVVAGTYAGSPHPADDDEIITRVRKARPNLLFVAYGAPAQDKWLARNLPRLELPLPPTGTPEGVVGIGVGGVFDFLSGAQKRAPNWMQQAGLEWFYRLIRQPWRWRRQLSLARFVIAVMLKSN